MITAKEAREKIDSIEHGINKSQLKEIENDIVKAVNVGLSHISVATISSPNKKHLESLGYEVKYFSGDQRDMSPGGYTISW